MGSLFKKKNVHSIENAFFLEVLAVGIGQRKTGMLSEEEWGWQTELVDRTNLIQFVAGLVGGMHFVDRTGWPKLKRNMHTFLKKALACTQNQRRHNIPMLF